MRWIIVWPLVTVMVGGCVLSPSTPEPKEVMDHFAQAYIGKPVALVAQRFGVPVDQRTFQGQRIYVWHMQADKNWTQPVESTTLGTVSDRDQVAPNTYTYRQTTTSQQMVTSHYTCDLQVYVDQNEIVSTFGMYGQGGACMYFDPTRQ